MSGSRGQQRHHEEDHEEHVNHEAWVIPYADVLTLLMALFLVLWALGDPNPEKTEIAADSFRRELGQGGAGEFDITGGAGGGPLSGGGISVLDGQGPAPLESRQEIGAVPGEREGGSDEAADGPVGDPVGDPLADSMDDDVIELENASFRPVDGADEVLGDPLTEVERVVRETAVGSGLTTVVGFRRESRGLVVTIVSDSVLFSEGEADVQPVGIVILDVVADALRDIPNSVIIEGHTDSQPISTTRYPSNWELSTARATSVLRYLVEAREFPGERAAAAGYADTRPITEATDAASLALNRRVEIVVLATA